MGINEDPKFKYFIQKRGDLKRNTVNRYKYDLNLYANYIGKTLSELITEGRQEEEKYRYMDERKLPGYLIGFKDHLLETNHTKYRVAITIGVIKSFYREFEISTPRLKIRALPESHYLLYEELPQWEDIRKVITLSNTRYRALFSHMASSGMNSSDTRSLKVQDLLTALNHYFQLTNKDLQITSLDDLYEHQEDLKGAVPVWRVWRVKTNFYHITFSSPESLQFIIDYFKHSPPESLESHIFRMRNKRHQYRKMTKQQQINYEVIRHYLVKINKEAGWYGEKKIGVFNYVTSKTFRTFFGNELEDEGIRHEHIRLMMGHRMPGVTENYFKKNAKKMLESYIKGVHRLTFMEKLQVVDNTDEKFHELEEKNKELEDKNRELELNVDRKLALLEKKLLAQYQKEAENLPGND